VFDINWVILQEGTVVPKLQLIL